MILAMSRFRVANDKEEEVARAFEERPRLVEEERGFLGLEVFRDLDDSSDFYLLTRWNDVESFEEWHGSEAHRTSHQGIPKGLKLDPDFTEIVSLGRIEGASSAGEELRGLNLSPWLTRFLQKSERIHYLVAAENGRVLEINDCFLRTLKLDESSATHDLELWSLLAEADEVRIREEMQRGGSTLAEISVNFVDTDQSPATLRCWVRFLPDSIVFLGEEEQAGNQRLVHELLELNNELTTLHRENVRQNRELERTKKELEDALLALRNSHWLLRKIQEAIPICAWCGKMRSSHDSEWKEIVEVFLENEIDVSHGLCPECARNLE